MKVVLQKKYGSPEVLQFGTKEKPRPAEKEILVKVMTSAVNRTDCAILRAKPFIMRLVYGFFKPKVSVSGTEFAGIVEATGSEVNQFKVGDRVFGFEDMGLGAHAEYLVINQDKGVATLPQKLDFSEAAAAIEGAHYAYNTINKVEISEGQKILINGATGAIGSALLQILVGMGAKVTAVANTPNLDLIKQLGAVRVIDYLQEDFTKENEVYDFIFDAVGKSSFNQCKPQLKKGGAYISSELGWLAQNVFYSLWTPFFGNKKVLFPIPGSSRKSIALIKKWMERDTYRPLIDRQYPIDEIKEAYKYVETGEKTGNVVVLIG